MPSQEHDLGDQPEELRDVIAVARRSKRDWILVRTNQTPVDYSMRQ